MQGHDRENTHARTHELRKTCVLTVWVTGGAASTNPRAFPGVRGWECNHCKAERQRSLPWIQFEEWDRIATSGSDSLSHSAAPPARFWLTCSSSDYRRWRVKFAQLQRGESDVCTPARADVIFSFSVHRFSSLFSIAVPNEICRCKEKAHTTRRVYSFGTDSKSSSWTHPSNSPWTTMMNCLRAGNTRWRAKHRVCKREEICVSERPR